jgi:hypothetical protein
MQCRNCFLTIARVAPGFNLLLAAPAETRITAKGGELWK